MTQPPHGEQPPQDPDQPGWGWGRQPAPGGPSASAGWWGPPSGRYDAPGQHGGYGHPPGQAYPYGPPGHYGQPGQYGTPPTPGPYGGGGEPQPPRRRPKRRRLLGFLVPVVLIAAVANLPSFGTTRLDPQTVQRDVAGQYEERERVALDLDCDDRMTVEEGSSYGCEGTTAEGDRVTVTITITSQDGDYTWSLG